MTDTSNPMPLAAHALVLVLLVAIPLWDMWDAHRLRRADSGRARETSYLTIIAVLWALTFWVVQHHPVDTMLVLLGPFLSTVASAAVTVMILGVLLLPVAAAAVHTPTRARVVAASAQVAYMLPQSRREMGLFAAVSVSAGICEEVIFRAFLPRYFVGAPFTLSPVLAVSAAALMFGLAHAGQGWRGMGVATAAGLVFSGMYHATGTLLVPILLHAVVDLRAIAFALFAQRVASDSSSATTEIPLPATLKLHA